MNGGYIALATPAFALLVGLELVHTVIRARRDGSTPAYTYHDTVANLSCGLGSQLFVALDTLQGITIYKLIADHSSAQRAHFFESTLGGWLLGMLLIDFCYFVYHLASHRVAFLWATHAVHHQSEEYNFSVALRQSWFSGFFAWVFYLPLALLGLPTGMMILLRTFNSWYQFLLHTRAVGKLGILEKILNTPSHHRVHHGIEAHYVNRNYGGILIIWDRLLATFQEEHREPTYGTLQPLRSVNPVWANCSEWLRLARLTFSTRRPLDKLRVWLMPPEWRPASLPLGNVVEHTRHEVRAPRSVNIYVGLHFVLLLLASIVFMQYEAQLHGAGFLLFTVELVLTMAVLGGLAEGRGWARWLEILRLTTLAFLAAFGLRRVEIAAVPLWIPAFTVIIASVLWLLHTMPLPTRRALPASRRSRLIDCALALCIFAELGTYYYQKISQGIGAEMLFGCHVIALILAFGLLFDSRRIASLSLVFYAGLGVPMWLVDVIATQTTSLQSIIGHVVPPVAAAQYVVRRGMSGSAALWAFAIYLPLLFISYFFTDPALNVNLIHTPNTLVAYFAPGVWIARIFNVYIALQLFFLAEVTLAPFLRKEPP